MNTPTNSEALPPTTGYARPATRGELLINLRRGIASEVASHVVEMTDIMLHGWLEFDSYTVRPSENAGWSVYEHNRGISTEKCVITEDPHENTQ